MVQIGLGLALPKFVGVPIQAAIPLAYVCAVITHFSLQRWFVFAKNDFEHDILGQLARYLPMTGSQYAFTALATALLPEPLGVTESAVYVAAALISAAAAFLFMRLYIFHEG